MISLLCDYRLKLIISVDFIRCLNQDLQNLRIGGIEVMRYKPWQSFNPVNQGSDNWCVRSLNQDLQDLEISRIEVMCYKSWQSFNPVNQGSDN